MKKPSQKDNFPTDSIETENSCELFSMVSNIAQQLKTMFDYVVAVLQVFPNSNVD